jgi:hypothetical protein
MIRCPNCEGEVRERLCESCAHTPIRELKDILDGIVHRLDRIERAQAEIRTWVGELR